jgi:hypothetical protein
MLANRRSTLGGALGAVGGFFAGLVAFMGETGDGLDPRRAVVGRPLEQSRVESSLIACAATRRRDCRCLPRTVSPLSLERYFVVRWFLTALTSPCRSEDTHTDRKITKGQRLCGLSAVAMSRFGLGLRIIGQRGTTCV